MFSHQNSKGAKIAIHAGIWLFLLLLPFLFSFSDNFDGLRFLRFSLVPMLFHAVIFYSNYLFLIERFLFNKKVWQFFILNILLVVVLAWLMYSLKHFLGSLSASSNFRTGNHNYSSRYFIYKYFLSMLIPVIVSVATRITEKWSATQAKRKEVEKETLKSELLHLKYQLQPHFFFNSLNTIYAMVEKSPQLAQETIHNLSNMMRYMLYETDKDKSSLCDEIRFMNLYIALMKLRISENIVVKVEFPETTNNIQVAPLLYVSLIENAFKHGISSGQSSELFFRLTVQGNKVNFLAENTNFPKKECDKSGSGIGIVNLQKRLEIFYPGKHFFRHQVEGSVFSVFLEIET